MLQNKKRIISLILMLTLMITSLVFTTVGASAADESVTLSIAASKGTLNSGKTEISWTSGDVTVTNLKSSSSTAIRTSDTDHFRVYANSAMKFSVSSGNITKIVVTCTSSSYATVLKNSVGSEATVSGSVVTIVPTSTASEYKIEKITAQTRINKVVVSYSVPSGTCQHANTTTTTTPATCTTAGSTVVACNDCDYKQTTAIPALGHKGGTATCDELAVCETCGKEYGNLAPHSFVNGTCSACGSKLPAEATVDFATTAQRTEFTTSKQVWQNNGLVVTNNKASSTTNVADYSDPVRFYKSSQVVIAFPGMTSLSINAGTGDNTTGWKAMLENAGYSVSVANGVYTVTFAEPVDSITLTCSEQVRAKSITAYGSTASECEHADTNGDFKCDECGVVVAPKDGDALTIGQALALGALTTTEEKYYLTGTITGFYGDSALTYGNVYITDGTNTILIYGLYSFDGTVRYDAMITKPGIGDEITVYGIITSYNGVGQMKDGWLDELVQHTHEYSYDCDADCNICGATREASHEYTNACDKVCKLCGEETRPEATHSYNSVVTAPTCEVAGYTTYACACGDSYVADEVAATGHSIIVDEAVAPDCTNTGLTAGEHCENCDYQVAQDVIPAKGHSYNTVVIAPTCEAAGYTTYTCACGDTYVADEVAATGHAIIVDKAVAADCTNTGLTAGEHCENCDYKVAQEVVPTIAHSYNSVVTAPDCVNGGYTTYTCSACGDVKVDDEVAALGHTWVDATCVLPKTCSVCGATEGVANGHSYNSVVTAPTCTEAGYTTYTCTCGDTYTGDNANALGHNYVDGECSRCDEKEPSVSVNIKDYASSNGWEDLSRYYTIKVDEIITITASDNGSNNGKFVNLTDWKLYRSDSGTLTISVAEGYAIVSITLTYEIYNNGILVFNGTNVASGTELTINSNSAVFGVGNTNSATNGQIGITNIDVVYAKLECTHENTTTTTENATCTEAGSTTVTCDGCGWIVSVTDIPALGHSYVDGQCSYCGAKKVSINIADYASSNNWENLSRHSTVNMDDIITLIASENGSNNGKFVNGKEWKIYRSENGTLTVSAAKGYVIVSITITYENSNSGVLVFNGTNIATGTELTINSTSAVFGVGNTNSATNGQIGLTKIEVVYEEIKECPHSETETATVTATCTADGSTTVTCKQCGEVVETTVIPATGHSYNSVVTAPTYEAQGYTTYTCSVCGDSYVADYVNAKTPSGKFSYRGYVNDSSDREGIAFDLENVGAGESVVIKVYDANGNLLTTTTLKAGGVEAANYTCNIVLWGRASGSWDTVISAEKLTVANIPAKAELYCDGVLVDTYENALGAGTNVDQVPNYCALQCVYKEAKIGNTYYATLQAALDAAQNGDVVTLIADVAVSSYLDIKTANNGETTRNFTIDLNGKTISPAEGYNYNTGYPLVFVGINQTVTIKGEGTITAAKKVTVGVYGTLTVEGGTIVNGGTSEEDAALAIYYWNHDLPSYEGIVGGTGYVKGGNFVGYVHCDAADEDGQAVLEISGGTFTNDVTEYLADGLDCKLNEDGKFEIVLHVHSYNAVVTDPTFEEQGYTTHTCACGDSYVDSYVDALVAVAQIGGTKYESLQAALDAAQNGDVVTLIADVAVSNYLDIKTANNGETTRNFTIDLNGKTISPAEGYNYNTGYPLLFIGINQTVTIKGEGTITAAKKVTVGVYGTLTVEGGTIVNGGTSEEDAALAIYYWNHDLPSYEGIVGGTGYVKGGNFVGYVHCDAADEDGQAVLEISGGTFTNDVTEYLADGLDCKLNEDGKFEILLHVHVYNAVVTAPTCTEAGYTTYTCACGDSYVADQVAALGHNYVNGVCVCGKTAISIGESVYANLSEAIAAAKDGDIIKLNSDIVYNGVISFSANAKIDLNGNTLTADALVIFSGNGGIIDSTHTGILNVPHNRVMVNQGTETDMLPVWNENGTGYSIVEIKDQYRPVSITSENSFFVEFKPGINGAKEEGAKYFGNGGLDNDVSYIVKVNFIKDGNVAQSLELKISEELVGSVYTNNTGFKVTFTGASTAYDSYEIVSIMRSTTGYVHSATVGVFTPAKSTDEE